MGVKHHLAKASVAIFFLLGACLAALPVAAERVQIATFHYPPVMDSRKPEGGIMGEIVRCAFNEVNIEPDLVYFPAKRVLLNLIGTQQYLACIGPVVLVDRQPEEKKRQVDRFPPLVDILMVFAYYRPTHGDKPTTYRQLTDFRGMKVATILGSNTIPLLQGAGINVEETTIESQMKLLKANRIDFSVVGYLTGLDLISQLFPGQGNAFAFIRKPIMELPTSIYFNKRFPGSEAYRKRFSAGLDAIVKNGKYLQILERYYGKGNIPVEYQPLFKTLGVNYAF